jgi:phosphate transport system permease protein
MPTLPSDHQRVTALIEKGMVRRRAAEARFRNYGRICVIFTMATLAWLLFSISTNGIHALTQNWLAIDLTYTADVMDDRNERRHLAKVLANRFDVQSRPETEIALLEIISASAGTERLRNVPAGQTEPIRFEIPLSAQADRYLKGRSADLILDARAGLSDQQVSWLEDWREAGLIQQRFNTQLFTHPDSRNPERAGLASALFGSIMIIVIAGLLAIPVGIGAAIYLDGFAPQTGWGGRITRAIEVNINNLAAVPAIVFGLLGLAIFINLIGLSRSIALVGGLVMALRMFPTIVIASRSALQAVPDSMTDSALSLGASRMQAIFNHKVPIAAPSMLTGSIIGMAQALGETAPLLMIGMVAFVTTVPATPMDPATALPVQIFLWSGSADPAWSERASAAIIVLLLVLIIINGLAVLLRQHLQKRTET